MITKAAEDKTNFTQDLVFTNSARSAWSHLLSGFQKTGQPKVLLPAYIGFTEREGSGVFDPIKETSAGYQFYKVDRCLKIDVHDFARLIELGEVNIALVIHYFGFCRNDMAEIKRLCARHGVLLVEDCAHAMQSGLADARLGAFGDFSFFSLHKYLAVQSGGVLKANSTLHRLPTLPPHKRIDQDVLEQYIKTRFDGVSATRRANYLSYIELLPKHPDIELMFDLLPDETPQTCPIRIKHGKRERLYFYLIGRAMPVTALYYRLIEEIGPEQFPVSFTVSAEIMNLPVHQDTTRGDVQSICSAIGDFFSVS